MKNEVKVANKLDLTGLKKGSPSLNNGSNSGSKGKKILKGILKKSLIGLALCGTLVFAFKGNAYYVASENGLLDFGETTYRQNINITPGYYNANPIKIYISGAFGEVAQKQIIAGIQYLDSKAEGLKFEYEVGHHLINDFDIYIQKAEFGSGYQSGEATVGRPDSGQIAGVVRLEEYWESQYLLTPLTVHELCHVIGLRHSKDLDSIMYPVMSTFTLSKEDIQNINTMYPDGDFEK